jgi:anaerobic selenocysteine-containing dehydrogenase
VELSPGDAADAGVEEGDLVRVVSPRGALEAPARINGIRPGLVFVPFHYGYWDAGNGASPEGAGRAANELTITAWDPVSKQPQFKLAAVRIEPAEAI